jgi:ArsR family metal-binding transcriptional regulator
MTALPGYHEWISYSPEHDCEMARLWMYDARGSEFFRMIPVVFPMAGKHAPYRERRAAAVETIYEAIIAGYEPGEVHVT